MQMRIVYGVKISIFVVVVVLENFKLEMLISCKNQMCSQELEFFSLGKHFSPQEIIDYNMHASFLKCLVSSLMTTDYLIIRSFF